MKKNYLYSIFILLLVTSANVNAEGKLSTDEKVILLNEDNKLNNNQEISGFFKEKPLSTSINDELITKKSTLNLVEVFSAAPFIYSILLSMSVGAVAIFLFTLVTLRAHLLLPQSFIQKFRSLLSSKHEVEAMEFCLKENHLLSKILLAGLSSKNLGPQIMIDSMKSEGRKGSLNYWQRLSLLNDIVVIAPMLGLLGTVIGMFYAFYDINRSVESITALFDGLGIAVGTTVCGLFVSIMAMIFYTTIKQRLSKILTLVETEAFSLAKVIASTSIDLSEHLAKLQDKAGEKHSEKPATKSATTKSLT